MAADRERKETLMKKILQGERFKQVLNNIQDLKGQREIFLKLLETAKQAASDDISANCPEYNEAWDKEMKLIDECKEKGGQELFNQYVNAAEETNNIWAEEMYLRGIQDALLFIAIADKKSVTDIIGVMNI